RMSIRPSSDTALAIMPSTSAFFATSATIASALTPSARASLATASASPRLLRELTTTLAPSAASLSTVARPMFRPDPVTSATLPSSLPTGEHCCRRLRHGRALEELRIPRSPQAHRVGEGEVAEVVRGDEPVVD